MVEIKAGETGVVLAGDSVEDPWFYEQELSNSNHWGNGPFLYYANGSEGSDEYTGITLTWAPFNSQYPDRFPDEPSHSVSVLISVASNAAPGGYFQNIASIATPAGWYDRSNHQPFFIVPGPLTGSVTVSSVNGLEACVDLKADATAPYKVISVAIDWGDGNSTTISPAPNAQHYFGHACHTYAAAGTYTITATYQDDASNTINPTTEVTVDCLDNASMSIELSGSSNGNTSLNGVFTHCYTATVSHSSAPGESYSYAWTFPDNTILNSGGGTGDTTAAFCVVTTKISGQSNFGIVSCTITKTLPTPSCDVTVSGQVADPGAPPPPPGGPPPGGPGGPPC